MLSSGDESNFHAHFDPCSQELYQFGNSRELVTALPI